MKSARNADGAQLPAVVSLAQVSGAAEAEEAIGVRIGIEIEALNLFDAGCNQPVNYVIFKVEVRLASLSRNKEARIVAVSFQERRPERLVDLVRDLSDAWADRGVDMSPPRAQFLHRLDHTVGDARKRASPARMCCSNDDRVVVSEKDRRAIGGEDSKEKIGLVGDHGIRPRALVLRPCPIGNDDFGRVNLVDCRKFRLGKKCGDCKAAISSNRLRIVMTSKADV